MNKIRVGLVGAGGYTGGELLRILVYHPEVMIVFAHSHSQAGKPVTDRFRDLTGDTQLRFTTVLEPDIDVLFLCLGHGESSLFLEKNPIPDQVKIIDLSQDFRVNPVFSGRTFTYGLPEYNRAEIRKATNIANPGCFATAIQLALLPLISQWNCIVSDLVIFGTTGSTGAGRLPSESSHFSWRTNNLSVYKPFTHQHLGEIKRTLQASVPDFNTPLHFIPQRGNFSRGILAGLVFQIKCPVDAFRRLFLDYYQSEPFVYYLDQPIDLKTAVNTNKVFISIDHQDCEVLVNVALDNLVKGASGQAVQNMNLMQGLDERMGLHLKSIAY